MKKTTKKLSLNKETVQTLTEGDLNKIGGGGSATGSGKILGCKCNTTSFDFC